VRFLFVHHNFPGQYLHIVRHLVQRREHQVVFLTTPNANRIPGVILAHYHFEAPAAGGIHPGAREFQTALCRADAVAAAARELKTKGFTPDVIVGHHGWGELLNLGDVWPGVPVLGYCEFYYRTSGLDVDFDPEFANIGSAASVRAMNAVNHLALTNGGMGQTPTAFQMSTYPECFQNRITLLREGVDLNACRPAPEVRRSDFRLGDLVFRPEKKVVTFLSRTLEPYRGFHVFMRSLPRLMRERPDLRVVVVGGTERGYGPKLASGTWKDHFLNEVRGKLDGERLHFVGRLDGGDHLRLFQRSDAHVYLTYPFVLSWSLREALACGTPVVCNDVAPVREFVRDGVNGLLFPGFDPDVLAGKLLGLLDDPWLDGQLRDGARVFAERHLAMEDYLRDYDALLAQVVRGPGGAARAA